MPSKNNKEQDSIININDSIDLTPYINAPHENEYFKIKVWTQDLQKNKEYRLSVRVHHLDPDSLNWGNRKDQEPAALASGFSNGKITGKQKAVILDKELFVYAIWGNQLIAYKTLVSDGKTWERVNVQELADVQLTEFDLSSIIEYNGSLYMVAKGQIYHSSNGSTWKLDQSLNQENLKFATLLTSIQPDSDNPNNKKAGISAIVSTDGGENYQFYVTDESANQWNWNDGEKIPDNFPRWNITSTVGFSATNVPFILSMGVSIAPLAEETTLPIVPWSSYDGLSWVDLSVSSSYCPELSVPSVITYNEEFYAFGNDFTVFYTSPSGLTWKEANKKFYFPKKLTERTGADYSVVVDKNDFIWIICSKNANGEDEVWRGRLNKLGFDKK